MKPMAAAKAEGYEMTKDEADAYMAKIHDLELDDATLTKAAGGAYFYGGGKAAFYPWKRGDDREDMEPGKMPEAFLRGEITGGEDF